jgi:hypothetical protein
MDYGLEQAQRFLALADTVDRIIRSEMTWELKYSLVFTPEVIGRLRNTKLLPDYCDPDTSYEDDVRALHQAVAEVAEQLRLVTAADAGPDESGRHRLG